MKKEINKQLDILEEKNGIKIIFAVETGSRAWRMESKDSDYDVRFVYYRPINDYLKINKLRDVIEYTIGDIDVVGFDIYKFTKLLLNSNPSMIEWLKSDILYRRTFFNTKDKIIEPKEFMLDFIERKYNPIALYHHYRSMCKKNYLKYLKTRDKVTYKKYLYAMRGLVNAKFVENNKNIPPISFSQTLSMINCIPVEVTSKLFEVITIKKQGKEKDKQVNLPEFDTYIESFLKIDNEVESKRLMDYKEIQDMIYEIVHQKTE